MIYIYPMRRFIHIFIVAFGLSGIVIAQQLPQFTNYMINDYVINPALSGTKDYFEVKSNNRYQWVGITDAPRTFTLSANGPYKSKNMGYGGYVFTDITGPTRRIGLTLSYAYHLKINDTYKLSLGLNGGLLQFSVDGSKITLRDQNDLALSSGVQSVIVPDFGFGAMLRHDKFYAGVSVPQLYQSKLKFFDYTTSTLSKLATHFYVMGGYKYDLNDKIRLEPSVLIKYVSPAPVKIDIGVRAIYKEMMWAGVAYRTKDAITALVGYTYQNYLTFAYAYDMTTTNLRNYSTGTHEIMFGLRFNNKPKA